MSSLGLAETKVKVVPPETAGTEDCAVIALTFVLLKLLFDGVSVEGAVTFFRKKTSFTYGTVHSD
ncbi:hypothetical protein GCM10020331_008320 [Ectobacillus funiculus]